VRALNVARTAPAGADPSGGLHRACLLARTSPARLIEVRGYRYFALLFGAGSAPTPVAPAIRRVDLTRTVDSRRLVSRYLFLQSGAAGTSDIAPFRQQVFRQRDVENLVSTGSGIGGGAAHRPGLRPRAVGRTMYPAPGSRMAVPRLEKRYRNKSVSRRYWAQLLISISILIIEFRKWLAGERQSRGAPVVSTFFSSRRVTTWLNIEDKPGSPSSSCSLHPSWADRWFSYRLRRRLTPRRTRMARPRLIRPCESPSLSTPVLRPTRWPGPLERRSDRCSSRRPPSSFLGSRLPMRRPCRGTPIVRPP